MHWFDASAITRSLPMPYRAYAWYSRLMANRSTGIVRGGSLLLSLLIFVVRTLQLKGEALVPVGSLKVWFDLCDRRMLWVFGELLEPGHESRIMRSSISEGDTFLDIGANHGSYSLMAAQVVGPAGTVVAFEPQPRLASLIRRSFEANGLRHCKMYEVACSDRDGLSDFYIPSAGSGSGGLYERFSANADHRRISVKTVRFDDAIDWKCLPGRVLIKIDVEGSEFSFLLGAERMLRCRRPRILFEINPVSAQAAGHSVGDVLRLLGSLGYARFAEIDRYPETTSLREVDCTRQRNLLALPS
jgi:FkbM family methyltransferase